MKNKKMNDICGVDESGAGCLAGDLIISAVILSKDCNLYLRDSKKLSDKRRRELFKKILECAEEVIVVKVPPSEIDRINIFNARMEGMRLAVEGLRTNIDYVYFDGNRAPNCRYPSEALVKADDKIESVRAASIIAKVLRDDHIMEKEKEHPQFCFSSHKGYGTKKHKEEIAANGPSCIHRKSFKPISTMTNSFGSLRSDTEMKRLNPDRCEIFYL